MTDMGAYVATSAAIKSLVEDDLEIAFESGAQMVTGGSIAVKNPEMFTSWISKFGSEKIILGADAKEKKIAISGWEETTSQELIPFIKGYYDKGITKVSLYCITLFLSHKHSLSHGIRRASSLMEGAFA